jgi:hypothetical protein
LFACFLSEPQIKQIIGLHGISKEAFLQRFYRGINGLSQRFPVVSGKERRYEAIEVAFLRKVQTIF